MIKSLRKRNRSNSWKKIILSTTLLVVTVMVTLTVFIISMSREVPSSTEKMIDEVLASGLPDLIMGDTGIVRSNAMEIWYESIKSVETPKGTIMLIMGLGGTALEWPDFFVKPLVDAGYHVIRFDNRGTGLSTWTERGFNISDMARDAIAVMDGLGVEDAHVVGMSMGGMIAQQIAIDYPYRVKTLTTYSSSADVKDAELPNLSNKAMLAMTATAIRYQIIGSERNSIRAVLGIREVLANHIPEERKKALIEQTVFNERLRRRGNPNALVQHTRAIFGSGSRYEGLKNLRMPVLIIHGREDPLIPVEHADKVASLIPRSRLLLIDGLGHDINPDFTDIIHEAIFDLMDDNVFKRKRVTIGKDI